MMTTAEKFMSKPIQTIAYSESVKEAAKQMKKQKVSSLIVKKNNKPYGMVTERDFVHKFCTKKNDPDSVKVGELASRRLLTVEPETRINEVCKMFDKKNIRHVVVEEKSGSSRKVVGVITISDILKKVF